MKRNEAAAGSPAWVMTFADLMSLLLAFFVLLFSFSELDKAKYKQVAGSMRDAFGVQQQVRVKDPPKGLNIIAREFSPGVPQPTALNEVRQFTTSDSLPFPVLAESKRKSAARPGLGAGGGPGTGKEQLADGERLAQIFKPEIDQGLIELEIEDHRIIVRIREKGAFPSGSDRLERAFEPIIERLGDTLVETSGRILVAGHTDSIPIENALFRSNWELSMARALTVAHVFFARSKALEPRTQLEAHAEFRPLDDNATAEGRARNRRVEISLIYGIEPLGSGPGEEAPAADAAPAPPENDGTVERVQP